MIESWIPTAKKKFSFKVSVSDYLHLLENVERGVSFWCWPQKKKLGRKFCPKVF